MEHYAAIYDSIGQATFSEQMAAQVIGWLRQQTWGSGPYRGRRVLDLACGTGAAALLFAAAGCTVVGLDQSEAMLTQARQSAARHNMDVRFVQGNVQQLTIDDGSGDELVTPHSFDLVTCFNGLNYLTDEGDLRRVCAAAAKLLQSEGLFVFNLRTEETFTTWDERDEVIYQDEQRLVYQRLNYEPHARQGTRRIVWFTREHDRWWRNEETHAERAWPDAQVAAVLADAALHPVDTPPASLQTADAVYYTRRLA